MKKLIFITIFLCSQMLFSQTADDVLRYSRIYYSGTARFVGTGGAFGALGADFSALAVNPAGIALFQKTEFSMTFAPSVEDVTTDYMNKSGSTLTTSFGMGNVGFVFTIKPDKGKKTGLLNFNFGFGMNRQNNFNSAFTVQGANHTSSLLNVYTDQLNHNPGYGPYDYPFDVALMYDAGLIYYDSTNRQYTSDQPHGGSYQYKQVRTYGSINEFDISMGANISDKLYFGLTFGIPFIRYIENSSYSEENRGDTLPYYNIYYFNNHLETYGTGFSIKGGIIYRPANWFRLGLAIHSPTWYVNMRDHWYSSVTAYYKNESWNNTQSSPDGNFNYYLRTPFRAIGSLAFIIGPYGLFSAEYEYVNYSQGKLNSSSYSYSDVNSQVRSDYLSWGNVRAGTEWKIADFRLRAGFAYYSNPYTTPGLDGTRYTISGGFGYRIKHFFTDVTYQYAQSKQDYYLYNYTGMQSSLNTNITHTVLTTIGFRF